MFWSSWSPELAFALWNWGWMSALQRPLFPFKLKILLALEVQTTELMNAWTKWQQLVPRTNGRDDFSGRDTLKWREMTLERPWMNSSFTQGSGIDASNYYPIRDHGFSLASSRISDLVVFIASLAGGKSGVFIGSASRPSYFYLQKETFSLRLVCQTSG